MFEDETIPLLTNDRLRHLQGSGHPTMWEVPWMAKELLELRAKDAEKPAKPNEAFEDTLVWIVNNSNEPAVVRAAARALLGGEVQR